MLIAEAASIAGGRSATGWPNPATAATVFQCPPIAGLAALPTDGQNGRTTSIFGRGTFAFYCGYARIGSGASASINVQWDETPQEPGNRTACGLPDQDTAAGNQTGIRRHSQTKGANLHVTVQENGAPFATLLSLGAPLLAEAEGRAVPCVPPPSAGNVICPPSLGRSPLATIGNQGAVQEQPNGERLVSCTYATGQSATIVIRWFPANPPATAACALPEERQTLSGGVTGPLQQVRRYSSTRAANLTATGQTDLVDAMLLAGGVLLAAAEAQSAACPRAAPPPTSAPAASATAVRAPSAVAGIAPAPGSGEASDVGPDDLYREGTVRDEGLASAVLEPGSQLPSDGEAAAAAAAVAGVIAAAAAVQATRAGGVGGARSRGGIRLPAAVQDKLISERDRVLMDALARHGITPPMVAALGGLDRVVRLGRTFVRNPVKAVGALLKDTFHNLTHPKDLARHVLNGIKRVIESSPAGPVVKLLRRIFRRRPRRPGTPQAGSMATQRTSDPVAEPGPGAQSTPPGRASTFEEVYGPGAIEDKDAPRGSPP